jgi:folylpolyglutamate synthase/dihydropteroate synthase
VSPIGIEKDIQKAVEKGLAVAEKEDIVLCFGSLYLVGRVRTLFRR